MIIATTQESIIASASLTIPVTINDHLGVRRRAENDRRWSHRKNVCRWINITRHKRRPFHHSANAIIARWVGQFEPMKYGATDAIGAQSTFAAPREFLRRSASVISGSGTTSSGRHCGLRQSSMHLVQSTHGSMRPLLRPTFGIAFTRKPTVAPIKRRSCLRTNFADQRMLHR
jgi:hypothetical protein